MNKRVEVLKRMASFNYENSDTTVFRKDLYPYISKLLEKNTSRFMANINKFINDRHEQLFDIAPYDRIYFNKTDEDALYKSMGADKQEIENIMKNCFFWDVPYNPPCAKEPYVMALMMGIRYYLKTKKEKQAEITAIYLAFSGKFYCSLHAGVAFPKVPPSKYREVMDYVVNNMLTDKFDLKREGSVFGAVRSLCITWLNTYKDQIIGADTSDHDFGQLIQQLRGRLKSFLMNIAKLYYEAYENKAYLNYETDSLDADSFRLTNNDAATAARLTENTMNYLTSNYVSLEICNKCKDQNVKALEIKDIMESILADNKNLPQVKRVVNILICDFMRNYPGVSVGSVEFVSYSVKEKPNTKDKYLIELKETILSWLDENSPNYRKRKSRKATQISYYRSILMYIVLVINKVAR